MRYIIPVILFVLVLLGSSSFDTKKEDVQLVVPKGWPKPVYDVSKNKLTDEGFKLGRKLFFFRAGPWDFSCAVSAPSLT